MFDFKRTYRLLKKAEFDQVFECAKKLGTHDFIVLYKKNQFNHARLGFAIAKKTIAKAHDRNRIKRLIRESFRKTKLPAVDIVFLAKHGVSMQNNKHIFSSLDKTWEKLSK